MQKGEFQKYDMPVAAVRELQSLYETEAARIRDAYEGLAQDKKPSDFVRGFYPEIRVSVSHVKPPRDAQGYGFCVVPGTYRTTVGRLDIPSLYEYHVDQLSRLVRNHPDAVIEVGLSDVPIPLDHALNETVRIKGEVPDKYAARINEFFDRPDWRSYAQQKVDHATQTYPLAHYNGPRTDRSLSQLYHYTGTYARYFQPYVLFTNYRGYEEAFESYGLERFKTDPKFVGFVRPGNRVTLNRNAEKARSHFDRVRGWKPRWTPQMPAYHLVEESGQGRSIINVGVGAANVVNICHHLSVLRSNFWMMVGHCAGLEFNQKIGDYVFPKAFIVNDGITDRQLSVHGVNVQIPELSKVHKAIRSAVIDELDLTEEQYNKLARSGPVMTESNRNWDMPDSEEELLALEEIFSNTGAIALDMETATLCARAFRNHVPAGAFLKVSDMPTWGQPKLPLQARRFYRGIGEHFAIACRAADNVAQLGLSVHGRSGHTSYDYVPYR